MIKLFKAMANFMKKLKKKRSLSSELHTRWGDPSISYPNEGSWNQWNQPSGFVANATTNTSQEAHPVPSRRYIAVGTTSSQNGGSSSAYCSQNLRKRDTAQPPSTIPKGYFDERIRHRNETTHSPHNHGLGVADTSYGYAAADEESCDEEDEERDTLCDPGGGIDYHGRTNGGHPAREDHGPYSDHAARSPPLSVTSRMRRVSINSTTTEHSASVLGTASSRHTSYTAASSASAPSVSVPPLPPETPRHVLSGIQPLHVEKRSAHPSRTRYREPEPLPRHEMVPSYDELYG